MDASEAATAAALSAAGEARRRLLPVRLVRARSASDRRTAVERLEELRDAVAVRLPGGRVTTALREGSAVEVLLDEAGTAELLVLGSPSGAPDGVVGAVTRWAACPVLVVRSGGPELGPVVVGVAGDEGAVRLLSVAALQATTRGASLVVLDVGRDAAGTARLGDLVTALQATHPGVPIEWRPATRADLPTLLTAGRAAALLLVGRAGPPGRPDPLLDHLLQRSAAPVLVVPLDVPASSPLGRVRALTLSGAPS